MEISYIRSSSLNNYEYCQQQYFITYLLGQEQKTNIKTEVGTIVHKICEILSHLKLAYQNSGKYEYNDPDFGLIFCEEENWLKESILSDENVDKLNKSMTNRETYVDQKRIKYGHKRYGTLFVNSIIQKCYDFYSKKSEHEWTNIQFRNVFNFTWIFLDWNNGSFDPRKRTILMPEEGFNIEIKKPWAKIGNEYLRIKGTIDLTTIVDNDLEIIDLKTGARKNWATGKAKDYESLCKDPQLLLYYYAARQIFPQYKNILITIFFIRDGGPFTICLDDSSFKHTENMMKEFVTNVLTTTKPKLLDPTHKDFRCKLLCSYFKNKVDGTPYCSYIKNEIETYGIDTTILRNRKQGFSIGHYQQPGE